MELAVIFIVLALFAVVSGIWGANSTYCIDDPEWNRRHAWRGFEAKR
jgi:hypothetical protein